MCPVAPSTVTVCPFLIPVVADPVPTTAGMPCSRATVAECDRRPPVSVISPPMRPKSTDHAGVVMGQTSTSPGLTWSNCSSERITRAGPVYEPAPSIFSIGHVANRAGVAHRTVYNHFGSREGLIDALSEWIDDQWAGQGGVIVPGTLRELPGAVLTNFAVFEEQAHLADVVASEHPELSPEQEESVAVLLRQIASVRNWYYLTRTQGRSGKTAGSIAAWTIE